MNTTELKPAPSLGGENLVCIMLAELHAHLPEDQRPMSMCDLSDEQAVRAKKAVLAVLREWEDAKADLSQNAQIVRQQPTKSLFGKIKALCAASLRSQDKVK